jgi:hypothetical protein
MGWLVILVLCSSGPTGDAAGFPPDSGYIGRLDTIGGTTYDWWFNGSVHRDIVNAPGFGIHAVWMYSADNSGTMFPDRDMRYNFHDFATSTWNWIDPDFMQSGVNVFGDRGGYGNVDADRVTGAAVVSRHSSHNGVIHIDISRDVAPGAGIFEYSCGSPLTDGCQWPVLAVDGSAGMHIACSRDYELVHVRPWDALTPLAAGVFPTFNLAVSRVSSKVYICWTDNVDPVLRAYSSLSLDGGTTWGPVTELVAPPAYGGDTVTSFHITSLLPFYDQMDRLHVAANVIPVVHDTGYIMPAEVWHWCPDNSPEWSEVHRAGCDPAHLAAAVGYNATYACRPSIGEDQGGHLYVTWEQFDSMNVEPLTGLLRAGVWLAASGDNGQTWQPGFRITPENTVSHRYPCIIDWMAEGRDTTYALVLYLADQVAGFWVQNEGPATFNPVIAQWVPVQIPFAVSEAGRACTKAALQAWPSPAWRKVSLGGRDRCELLDAVGRKVGELRAGANDVGRFSPGVYVARDPRSGMAVRVVIGP